MGDGGRARGRSAHESERSRGALWHGDWLEHRGRVQIIFPRLVHYAKKALGFRFGVRQDSVDLSGFESRFESLVRETDAESCFHEGSVYQLLDLHHSSAHSYQCTSARRTRPLGSSTVASPFSLRQFVPPKRCRNKLSSRIAKRRILLAPQGPGLGDMCPTGRPAGRPGPGRAISRACLGAAAQRGTAHFRRGPRRREAWTNTQRNPLL